MSALAWHDGAIAPLAETRVAAEDRGYLFGDGVYEVIRAYGGRLFAGDDHLARLARSAAGIELALPFEPARFRAIAEDLLARTGLADAEVYMQVTRGVARRNHLFPADVAPSVLMWVQALRPADPALRQVGAQVVTLPDERWARCHLKTIALLANVLAKETARKLGAYEALLVRDGMVTEGTSSNAFVVIDGTLVTPRADHRILRGITRDRLIAAAAARGLACEERDVPYVELERASEVVLTSTLMELVPVAAINGRALAGPTGPVTARLLEAFDGAVAAETAAVGA